ncbi:GTPase ObgE [Chitinispirillales bacterium ANBcel5]|uniref:Obg family GTPase CgtA n=1 Tax=Cellulosispirillum alkaliphilum TaxID=3039283 RepID=UPI002A573F6B|nr:GTPase ObgE [Chitinispirillales bacterium ANBcel5]
MFIDETVIKVKAGDGGNGCHAYEKQKYKPKGRPDGGDGGRGGHVFVMCSSNVHTLQDAAYSRHYTAKRGAHGKGSNQTGKSAEDIIISVPRGTIIYDHISGEQIGDCITEGNTIMLAKGGRGGRGNASLASLRNPNPERSEAGKPGEEKEIRLELKVLADVGLVGRPNAGKSTLLSKISRAKPKIADYPFTTKEPNLGIVKIPSIHQSFVVADIPGLIEKCHEGRGLGIKFLRHIERTRVLAILVESISPDPLHDASVLIDELAHYSEHLASKPKCFIMTKRDILSENDLKKIPKDWFVISAITGEGLDRVIQHLYGLLKDNPDTTAV